MKITTGQAYSFYQLGQRANQEDARYPDLDCPAAGGRYYAVCDGVGGNEKGEVASSTVCQTIGRWVDQHAGLATFGPTEMHQILTACYKALYDAATPDTKDMATTLTFAAVHDSGITVAHMGDSRIYYVRPGVGILYRSDDHSLVNSLVHSGIITPAEAENHPRSNVITRCLTADPEQNPSAASTMLIDDVEAGDYLFLCSDGVLHCVSDAELQALLEDMHLTDQEKMRQLAETCRTSSDNNTAYLVPIAAVDGVEVVDVDRVGEMAPTPEAEGTEGPQTLMTDNQRHTLREVDVAEEGNASGQRHSPGKKCFLKRLVDTLFNR